MTIETYKSAISDIEEKLLVLAQTIRLCEKGITNKPDSVAELYEKVNTLYKELMLKKSELVNFIKTNSLLENNRELIRKNLAKNLTPFFKFLSLKRDNLDKNISSFLKADPDLLELEAIISKEQRQKTLCLAAVVLAIGLVALALYRSR